MMIKYGISSSRKSRSRPRQDFPKTFHFLTMILLVLLLFHSYSAHASTYLESPSSTSSSSAAAAAVVENGFFETCSEITWPSRSLVSNDTSSEAKDESQDNIDEKSQSDVERRIFTKSRLEKLRKIQLNMNKILGSIDNMSQGILAELCTTPSKNSRLFPDIPIGTHIYHTLQEKADLIAYFMSNIPAQPMKNSNLKTQFQNWTKLGGNFQSLYDEPQIQSVHFVEYFLPSSGNHTLYQNVDGQLKGILINSEKLAQHLWYFDPQVRGRERNLAGHFVRPNETLYEQLGFRSGSQQRPKEGQGLLGYWSWPYFQCLAQPKTNVHKHNGIFGQWLISYSVAFVLSSNQKNEPTSFGLLSFDVDLTSTAINQCGFSADKERETELYENPLFAFRQTHKCNTDSTVCHFAQLHPSVGWRKGNYECRCKPNHHAYLPSWNNTISGFRAESVWCKEITADTFTFNGDLDLNSSETLNLPVPSGIQFQEIVSCSPCPVECVNCVEGVSCLAEMNVVFRLVLLCVSIICSVGTFALIITVYKFRKLPIFKNSSPIFLCITLTGCIIMYSEMVALFPALTIASCTAVKWTRHLGFCVTYTALYMKLCRVYLTYRVKSAHKIKLTEKHLLHWMSPIMVIMLLYLFAWTISDPPTVEIMTTWKEKKFTQCIYNWWDHSLAIGEFIFLTYGVWICWRIRDNPDAQFISYSIYNIAVVNTVMVSIHLLIVPKAGPDLKYLFAFIRTQMSTTLTIALVLGSRLYHILRGDGDAKSKNTIANSANGFGHETLDLAEENQQLKEELQKMASQMERLKSYAMCKNNPHLKSAGSTVVDKDYGRLESFTAL